MGNFKLIILLLAANLALFACTSGADQIQPQEEKTAESSGVTEIMDIPIEELTCKTGGPGNSECKIEPGIKIGDFVTGGCSVSCREGYYACCGIRCICKQEESADI